jgi:hypothetical protein
MESIMSLIIGIGVILMLFSIFGITVKLSNSPRWKRLDPNKPWGKPGSDIEHWCAHNPKTKTTLVYLAQIIIWLCQIGWWLVKAAGAIFKKISPA